MAVASRPDQLVLHAGAVSLGGFGLLLPGPSGAGKSTLTAALVSGGFAYLSDEAAAIDPASLEIEPYPKPLSLHGGSLALLGRPVPLRRRASDEQVVACSSCAPAPSADRFQPACSSFPRTRPVRPAR